MNESMFKPLSCLNLGESGIVKCFKTAKEINRRLFDLGLIEGTKVSCVLKTPSGNPSAYYIRGAVIALRHEDCSHILVEV